MKILNQFVHQSLVCFKFFLQLLNDVQHCIGQGSVQQKIQIEKIPVQVAICVALKRFKYQSLHPFREKRKQYKFRNLTHKDLHSCLPQISATFVQYNN